MPGGPEVGGKTWGFPGLRPGPEQASPRQEKPAEIALQLQLF